ncbi:MAG: hypothetical protein HYU99_10700 [Deltaproteobacteria bacterium]|nr:hypothetical protein [Deltaproteobacteria bacterium]
MTKRISIILLSITVIAACLYFLQTGKTGKITAGSSLEENDEEEMVGILRDYGGMGDYEASGYSAKQDYESIQTELQEKFDEDPQKVIKPIEALLDREPGELETEKFLAIHALGKLPLEQGAPILKKEIEKELPDTGEGEGEEGTDVVIQALARKMAAVEALADHDPDYLLDLIEDPDTNRGVKRAAVEAYILTDDDRQAAVEEVRRLLSREEKSLLVPFDRGAGETMIKDFFLGGEEEEKPKKSPSGRKKKK